MRIVRVMNESTQAIELLALTDEDIAYKLPVSSFPALLEAARAERAAPKAWVSSWLADNPEAVRPWRAETEAVLLPHEPAEVWAAGVTYERTRAAKSEVVSKSKGKGECECKCEGEGNIAAKSEPTIYDKVYEADRPELFFKSTASRLGAPGGHVRLRTDSLSQVPEPELVLVLTYDGEIAGFTAGNDLSARDIEKANPLYIPQAKIWNGSCSIGPAIRLADPAENPYDWTITCSIARDEQELWQASASVGQLKRSITDLAAYLFRDNIFEDGVCLFTGTCIVPPEPFTLQSGDRIDIHIDRIGKLVNFVK
ncbi:2-dehydro-3-deoxy-D-arabinonate dehydratase [Paenibacillus taihuensis]|uniref:2-dehydro-3-deoxy-D-arabinonate dehydratase n=1 Tax=Paenibacillus taihuensis TaxID=1156355 RepID=A0A3D9SAB9_9BACL|nr:fumarylacetoacetate hydrolase family protein [Paenibacillus taihuensis]REE86533.1 2-dehydro-3-deoxy-D-arabinonate dehydratase [Paenibacillus taihuensis]